MILIHEAPKATLPAPALRANCAINAAFAKVWSVEFNEPGWCLPYVVDGSAVAAGLGLDTHGSRALGPLLGLQGEAVQARHFSNPIEFDGIKTGIVDLFPEAEELEGVAVAQPWRVFIGKSVWGE